MQLGTRWAPGDVPPARLPETIVAAVSTVESSMGPALRSSGRRWTLTWLEGRPIVELDPDTNSDDVVVISLAPEGSEAIIASGDPGAE